MGEALAPVPPASWGRPKSVNLSFLFCERRFKHLPQKIKQIMNLNFSTAPEGGLRRGQHWLLPSLMLFLSVSAS